MREKLSNSIQQNPPWLLAWATLVKILVIYFFYQFVIGAEGGRIVIAGGFGWDQLVFAMSQGKYEMVEQSGLSDIVNFKSTIGRPPIYAFLLYCFTLLGPFAAIAAVVIQAVITSGIALLGYKIVEQSTQNSNAAMWCMVLLFFFPMNFLKTGTVDEAPLMLLFFLSAVYFLGEFERNQERPIMIVAAGFLIGLALLTRQVVLPGAMLITAYMFFFCKFRRQIGVSVLLAIVILLTISPWLLRNYSVGDKITYSGGGERIILFTLSPQFIENFPEESPDVIERGFYRSQFSASDFEGLESNTALSAFFKRKIIETIKEDPTILLDSTIVKFRVFVPLGYYPARYSTPLKDIMFLVPYYSALIFFLYSLIRGRPFHLTQKFLFFALFGMFVVALVYFNTSRHLYPYVVLMTIFGFSGLSNDQGRASLRPDH